YEMKYLFAILVFAGLVLTGCGPDSSLTEPTTTQKTYKWIATPAKVGLSIENVFSASKLIDGTKGGKIKMNESYNSSSGEIKIKAKLVINKASFTGSKVISYVLDDQTGLVEFGPAMVFDRDLKFDLKIKGFDLSDVTSPDEVVFGFLDENNNIVPCVYDELKIKVNENSIEVKNARIGHFSRYGFAK
ncbi:MAG: hypothetical protein K8H86_04935, partial [Ignavibacteriaceae bacterium]|nr:hypothetical protein [Ignavibacteriaceae bacterium]